jgi:hypothetical protein
VADEVEALIVVWNVIPPVPHFIRTSGSRF